MTPVSTPNAPSPAGHYSQAVVHNGFVFVAGQLPVVPGSDGHHLGTVEEQVEQTMRNVESILRAAGSGLDRLVSVTIYITDVGLWGRVNATYARIMGPTRPARTVVPVAVLHYGYSVEIQAVGSVGEG